MFHRFHGEDYSLVPTGSKLDITQLKFLFKNELHRHANNWSFILKCFFLYRSSNIFWGFRFPSNSSWDIISLSLSHKQFEWKLIFPSLYLCSVTDFDKLWCLKIKKSWINFQLISNLLTSKTMDVLIFKKYFQTHLINIRFK